MRIEERIDNFLYERKMEELVPMKITDLFLDHFEGKKGYEPLDDENKSPEFIDRVESHIKGVFINIIKKILDNMEKEEDFENKKRFEEITSQVLKDYANSSRKSNKFQEDIRKFLRVKKNREKVIETLYKHRPLQGWMPMELQKKETKKRKELAKELLPKIEKDFSRKYSEFQTDLADGSLLFSTRKHGDTSAEKPGKEDIERGNQLAKEIKSKYDNVKVNTYTVDEKTMVEVEIDL